MPCHYNIAQNLYDEKELENRKTEEKQKKWTRLNKKALSFI